MSPGVGRASARRALWQVTHAERAALARDLATLTPDQWQRPSLCGRWTVEEVVAHLSAAGSIGRWPWIRSMVLAGFRPGVHNQRRLTEHLGATPAGTLRRFEEVVPLAIAPSSDLPAYLGEVVVHAQDIRRALGIETRPALDALLPVARFFVAKNFTVPSRRIASRLRLIATDARFTAGEGPEVCGPLVALVMCMAGRPDYLRDVTGPGVPLLRARIAGGDGNRGPMPDRAA
ncbi:maleylpyruvate isomerase family mycothiol-dependent enzyme [Arthrobacter sp. NamB2]|uniref:maleylpyruvate isomerase family mycothiol-dependent enzyme n=1 Tax=Arthrobacter sp. NamB2 TaxID=2576035 RepID=UPI001674EAEC|nr:maleylpyruvate isomerase family mycothiol-dependent enzyme [Arthrobacter sp. NamB2]